jgi:hypothetical protein
MDADADPAAGDSTQALPCVTDRASSPADYASTAPHTAPRYDFRATTLLLIATRRPRSSRAHLLARETVPAHEVRATDRGRASGTPIGKDGR